MAGSALGSASGFRPSSEHRSMRHLFITFLPRFTTTRPTSVITDRRRYTGVTTTGYVIIVTAAVAIDPTMHATACLINLIGGYPYIPPPFATYTPPIPLQRSAFSP